MADVLRADLHSCQHCNRATAIGGLSMTRVSFDGEVVVQGGLRLRGGELKAEQAGRVRPHAGKVFFAEAMKLL